MWRRLRAVTPAGKALAAVVLLSYVVARSTGLVELVVIAVAGTILLTTAVVLVALPADFSCRMRLRPAVIEAGGTATIAIDLTQTHGMPVLLPSLEVRGVPDTRQPLGLLRAGRSVPHALTVSMPRRGVFPVGPVVLHRDDPVGLVRWAVQIHEAIDLHVRPRTVRVRRVGTGSAREAEGSASNEISMDDLAFHALREYVPGDDLRHVHWPSSAKADRLLVRQYHDSRQSRAIIVLDTHPAAYASEAQFELAVSIAASLARPAIAEDQEVLIVHGDQVVVPRTEAEALDVFCRVTSDGQPIDDVAAVIAASERAADLTSMLVVSGERVRCADVATLSAASDAQAGMFVFRAVAGARADAANLGGAAVVDVAALEELPDIIDQLRSRPS